MKAKARKILAIKKNGKARPGSKLNPLVFDGVAACRSELLSNNGRYGLRVYVLVQRGVYQITSGPKTYNNGYGFSYNAKPIGMI